MGRGGQRSRARRWARPDGGPGRTNGLPDGGLIAPPGQSHGGQSGWVLSGPGQVGSGPVGSGPSKGRAGPRSGQARCRPCEGLWARMGRGPLSTKGGRAGPKSEPDRTTSRSVWDLQSRERMVSCVSKQHGDKIISEIRQIGNVLCVAFEPVKCRSKVSSSFYLVSSWITLGLEGVVWMIIPRLMIISERSPLAGPGEVCY